ncbi:thioredoxin H1-like [Nymphaea colorata]|nr:thioredoxin H1-like [Nymphaea colorata]
MATSEGVIACHNIQEWKNQIESSIASNKLVVVDFTASWCGPCRFMAPLFAEWARKFVDAIFLKVDVDELREVAEEWRIEAMPTFLLLKEGKEVERIVGAKKDDVHKKITEHLALPVSA